MARHLYEKVKRDLILLLCSLGFPFLNNEAFSAVHGYVPECININGDFTMADYREIINAIMVTLVLLKFVINWVKEYKNDKKIKQP